jgi:hypothetical protein
LPKSRRLSATRAELAALMDGRALSAKELSYIVEVTPQTTSGHLAKLSKPNPLILTKRGRRHYCRIASPLVSQMLESIMAIAGAQAPPPRLRPSRVEERVRTARTSASAQSLRGKLKLPAAGPVTGQRTETMIR